MIIQNTNLFRLITISCLWIRTSGFQWCCLLIHSPGNFELEQYCTATTARAFYPFPFYLTSLGGITGSYADENRKEMVPFKTKEYRGMLCCIFHF